jgi:putative tricarboxylic transport membrane protein
MLHSGAPPGAPPFVFRRVCRRMQLSDRVTGLFLVGLGGACAYGGWLLPPVPGQQIGPNVFPMVIGFGLILCGMMIAFGVGHSFEEEEELVAALPGEEPPPPISWVRSLLALLPPGLLVFYVYAVDRLGFWLTAGVITLVASMALGARLRLAIPLAIITPMAVDLIFSKLLRVPLPQGLLPMPW